MSSKKTTPAACALIENNFKYAIAKQHSWLIKNVLKFINS
ncbi:hypothetical protein GGR35_001848 [Mucilaginibacter phyllosphaerae]|uniref:Uncharacterized protein n=1 Tax=Mucilaginibacter phyllosphaerae TaxID=1812349 RepID=A0ABR6I8N9_9SPHI|nr:hypothetical protein [Mucilaginibacter phyllosphaerae]